MARKVHLSLCRYALLLLIPLPPALGHALDLTAEPREVVSTAAVVADGILYVASYEDAERVGHLRAFTLSGDRRARLWDAAEWVPVPGAALPPLTDPGIASLPPQFNDNSGQRLIFTNLDAAQGYQLLSFEARAAHALRPFLGAASIAEAAALINAVRGRLGTSVAEPAGSGDRLNRLGAISRSSPTLVGAGSMAVTAVNRDQLLYVGAEDGLLHAILAGRREPVGAGYDHAAVECGRELWAYLPGSLLPHLRAQPFDRPGAPPAVHVDGSPVVSDLFVDSDGDGFREWRTILVGTASVQLLNRGVVFALDVTDPRAPRLLWETALAELGPGRSRGAALGWTGGWANPAPRVFLTFGTSGRIDAEGTPAPRAGSYGVLACSLDLLDGRLLWRYSSQYGGAAAELAAPPSLPSLLTTSYGEVAGVVFGDLAGRLWVLDPESGAPRGGGPLWQTPGGTAEPIGAGLAVRDRLVLFGTGADEVADNRGYAVYAVEILAESARLLWTQPLAPGEKLWGAPVLDRFGRSYLGVGTGAEGTAGRLLVMAADGTLSGSTVLAGSPSGGPVVVSGAVVTVSLAGQVEQYGDPLPAAGSAAPGRVRVLSWRVR
ncbi:MAG: hypothetical protein FIB02_00465 [Desulfuromonas sp.]|nr:hypothetical protein [Desulfuromonas sp.]